MVFLYRIEWTAPKMIYAGIGLLWGFTAEIHNAVLGLFILILIDTITGFIAAPYRKQKRSSSRLRQFVPKIITYCVAIFAAFVAEKLTFPDAAQGIQLAYWVALALDGTELLSIFENLYDITGLPIFYFLSQLSLKKISEKIGMEVTENDIKKRKNDQA